MQTKVKASKKVRVREIFELGILARGWTWSDALSKLCHELAQFQIPDSYKKGDLKTTYSQKWLFFYLKFTHFV